MVPSTTLSVLSALKEVNVWIEIDYPTLSVPQGIPSLAQDTNPSFELTTGGELFVLVY